MSATSRPRRPLTRTQRLENAAFLRELRRTGNAREAARRIRAPGLAPKCPPSGDAADDRQPGAVTDVFSTKGSPAAG